MTKEENRLVYRKEIWEKKLKHGKMILSTLLKMQINQPMDKNSPAFLKKRK